MNRQIKKNIYKIIFSIIILSIIISFFYILRYYAISSTESANAKISYSKIEDILYPENNNHKKINEIEFNTAPEETNMPFQTVPILMYHHIRNYDKPEDKIGTNLSVSPEDFRSQLEYIQSKGYRTTTFEEIHNNIYVSKPIIITFDDGYKNFYSDAYPELKKRQMKAVVSVIANEKTDQYLNESEIKEISGNGIEISSHTLSHRDLSKISHDKAVEEISNSKIELEAILGKKIISFCYPAGKYNQHTIDIVKNSGYLYATTTKTGLSDLNNFYEIKRFRVNKDTDISKFIQ